jgi:hypothetical protein
MFSFKWWMLAAALSCALGQVAPQLTTIQDTLYNADGTRFNGLLTISWQSFDAADSSDVPSHVVRVAVTNGYLQVQLVPTAGSTPQVLYAVTYTGEAGVQFTETWTVPQSSTPLRVRDVRMAAGAGPVIASATQTIQISDVVGIVQRALDPTRCGHLLFGLTRRGHRRRGRPGWRRRKSLRLSARRWNLRTVRLYEYAGDVR